MLTPFGDLPDRLARGLSMQEQHEWFQRRISRRQMVGGLALGAVGLASAPSVRRQPGRAEFVGLRGRHITFGADPARDLVIEFCTLLPFGSADVVLKATDGTVHTQPAEVQTVPGSARRYCRARFTGLAPDTLYAYRIVVDGSVRRDSGFARTAFTDARAFRFTAFGDQGILRASQSMVQLVQRLEPRFHLLCGDFCYADSSGRGHPDDAFQPTYWDAWLDQNDPVTASMPWLHVPGNHEMEPGFGMHGYAGVLARVSPGGASPLAVPVATAFRVGSVGFVGLDSNDVSFEIPANRGWTGGMQTPWLDQTLAGFRAAGSGIDFIVAFMHHAPYSTSRAHASEGGIRQAWVPLFDKYSVDLAISGHNHCFERSRPLREGKVVGSGIDEVNSANGTTYITAGGGGQGGEPLFIAREGTTRVATADGPEIVTEDWSLPTKSADTSVLVVDVAPGPPPQMRLQVIAHDGRVLDHVTLARHARMVLPQEPGNAWEPWLIGGTTGAVVLAGGSAALLRRRSTAQPTDR